MKYLIALCLLTVNAYAGFTNINIGASPNDGTGDTLRVAFSKINSNFWMAADTNYVNSSTNLLATNLRSGLNPTNIDFVTNMATPTWLEGRVFYDAATHTLCYYTDQSAVTVNLGQEQHLRVVNKTGAMITNGNPVTVFGAQGNRSKVVLAQATTNTASFGYEIVGMATQDILDNAEGLITTIGVVNGIDTTPYVAGAVLYCSTNAGVLTTNKYSSDISQIIVGLALNSTVNGSVWVWPKTPVHKDDVTGLLTALTYLTNSYVFSTNYATAATNSLNTALRAALAQTNITSANVTGALGYSPQPASANLTNWSGVSVFATNGLTGFDAVNLTNLQAAQITGLLPMGTVASGLTNIPGPFLTTNTAARYYSYNGNALTNLSAGNLVSGTNTATIGIGSLAVGAAAKITLDGTTGGQTNQGALVITNTSQANTFLALAGNQTGSALNVIEYKTNNVSRFSVDSNGLLTSSTLVSTVVRSTGNAGWTLADNPVGGIPGLALNSSGRIYWSLGPNWWSTLDLALTRATNATLVVQSNVVAMGTITATNGFVHIPKALSFTGFTNIVLDASLGNKFTLTLTTNAFFATPSNLFPMQEFTIDVRQDSVGGRTVTFTNGGQWKFPSGQILTTTTNAGSWSIFSCMVSQYGTNVAVVQTLNFQ